MPADVVYRNQGLSHRKRSRFGKIYTHQHSTDQSRCIGNRHRVNLAPGKICLFKRLISKTVDRFDVLTGCNFRHDTTIDPVQVHL